VHCVGAHGRTLLVPCSFEWLCASRVITVWIVDRRRLCGQAHAVRDKQRQTIRAL